MNNKIRLFQLSLLCIAARVGFAEAAGDPISSLSQWLRRPAAERPVLSDQPFARAPLTQAQADEAIKLLWTDMSAQLRQNHQQQWQAKAITLGNDTMRFEKRVLGQAPQDGRSLYISMHGGGAAAAAVNDRQWRNQINLYDPPDGSLYIAPRAPTNDWDLWHKEHIDDFFDRLILDSVLFENVNPNKVYLMGYSAGGDGVYQLAPRMADRFAAVSMMAGHPNESTPEGLRNLPISLWIGKQDSAYHRNTVAVEWAAKLDTLQQQDPAGYIHQFNEVDSGHWMNGKDAAAIDWMAQYTRNPFPSRVVWKQDNVRHARFYWLAIPAKDAPGTLVAASIQRQCITIDQNDAFETLRIRLNDTLADLDKPVMVKYNDKILFNDKVNRTAAMIETSLNERKDPDNVYCAEINVTLQPDKNDEQY